MNEKLSEKCSILVDVCEGLIAKGCLVRRSTLNCLVNEQWKKLRSKVDAGSSGSFPCPACAPPQWVQWLGIPGQARGLWGRKRDESEETEPCARRGIVLTRAPMVVHSRSIP